MTREEFEKLYASWVGATEDGPDLREKLIDAGLHAMRCDCGESCCNGWQMRFGTPDLGKLFEKLKPAMENLGMRMAQEKEERFLASLIGKES